MPLARLCSWIHPVRMTGTSQRRPWARPLPPAMKTTSTSLIVLALLCLAALNLQQRWTWFELEDGVLWKPSGGAVVASEIARDTAADRAGLRRGDILEAIDGREVIEIGDVVRALHASASGQRLRYTIARLQTHEQLDVSVAPVPSSPLGLYTALAAVGIFSLLVGASVRVRRPDHQATLHFFWLTVAFFGMMAFSFTGRLDALDWTFYWGDLIAQLMLPALFLRALSVISVINGAAHGEVLTRVTSIVQRGQLVYLAISLVAGLAIMVRALRRVRSV